MAHVGHSERLAGQVPDTRTQRQASLILTQHPQLASVDRAGQDRGDGVRAVVRVDDVALDPPWSVPGGDRRPDRVSMIGTLGGFSSQGRAINDSGPPSSSIIVSASSRP